MGDGLGMREAVVTYDAPAERKVIVIDVPPEVDISEVGAVLVKLLRDESATVYAAIREKADAIMAILTPEV